VTNEINSDKLLLYNDIKLSLTKMHEKSDKLSLIKLNFIRQTSFFRSNYVKRFVTYKNLEKNSNIRDKLSQM